MKGRNQKAWKLVEQNILKLGESKIASNERILLNLNSSTSKLRKKGEAIYDKKYEGKKSSRKSLMEAMDEESEEESEEEEEDDFEDLEGDVTVSAFPPSDEDDEDIDSQDSEEEEDLPMLPPKTKKSSSKKVSSTTTTAQDEKAMMVQLKQAASADVEKGRDVKKQLVSTSFDFGFLNLGF